LFGNLDSEKYLLSKFESLSRDFPASHLKLDFFCCCATSTSTTTYPSYRIDSRSNFDRSNRKLELNIGCNKRCEIDKWSEVDGERPARKWTDESET